MFEVCYLDDVGQAYDIALRKPEMIGTTLGRHANDEVTSFYSWSPSKFLVEYGWGGRTIDTANWTPHERTEGPSLWGHDRTWLTPEGRDEARDLRMRVAEAGGRVPVNVHRRQLSARRRRLPVVERRRDSAQDGVREADSTSRGLGRHKPASIGAAGGGCAGLGIAPLRPPIADIPGFCHIPQVRIDPSQSRFTWVGPNTVS